MIENNLITDDLFKYSIPRLESLYFRLCRDRIDLQIQISLKMHRKAYLDILPRNYRILEYNGFLSATEGKEFQKLLNQLEEIHSKCLDCFWTSEYMKALSRHYALSIEDFEACLRFYDFWETLNDIQQKIFMKYADMYSDSYMSTTKIIDFLKHDKNYIKKVLAFIDETGEASEIFSEDVSI